MSVEGRIRKIASEHLGVQLELITAKSDYANDLKADSLDHVEMIMAVEEEFGIEIPDPEAEKLMTIGETADYVEEKLKEKTIKAG